MLWAICETGHFAKCPVIYNMDRIFNLHGKPELKNPPEMEASFICWLKLLFIIV